MTSSYVKFLLSLMLNEFTGRQKNIWVQRSGILADHYNLDLLFTLIIFFPTVNFLMK